MRKFHRKSLSFSVPSRQETFLTARLRANCRRAEGNIHRAPRTHASPLRRSFSVFAQFDSTGTPARRDREHSVNESRQRIIKYKNF